MKKKIALGSLGISFAIVIVVYMIFLGIREEAYSTLERTFARVFGDYVIHVRKGIYDGYFCWDDMKEAVEKRNVEFISQQLDEILEDYPVKAIEISWKDFRFSKPVDWRVDGCPATPDIVLCSGEIIMNIPITDDSGENELEGALVRVSLDTDGVLSENFKGYKVFINARFGSEVFPGIYLSLKRPRVLGIRTSVILLIVFVTSFSAFWRIITRYVYRARDESILISLVKMMELRDPYTAGHSRRVAKYSRDFARSLGMDRKKVTQVYKAGLLHDIGKIGIPERILLKPGPLTDSEYEIIKKHPVISQEILEMFEGYEDVARIVRYHHERCNGTGYPDGLTCDEIPLESKIIAIVDVYEALTSDRAYRGKWDEEKALKFLKRSAGELFDENLVEKFLDYIKGLNV